VLACPAGIKLPLCLRNDQTGAHIGASLCVLLCLLILSACQSQVIAPTPTPNPPSLWGDVQTIGITEQAQAPAITRLNGQLFAAWTGADDIEPRQIMRRLPDSSTTILALPVRAPLNQSLFPAADDMMHLLWQDQDPSSGTLRLFAATVNPALVAELGPNPVSDQRTGQYAAFPNADASLQIVWSGGRRDEPQLYTQGIDGVGRIGFPVDLNQVGSYPTITQTDEGIRYLFWRRGDAVFRAELYPEGLQGVQRIADAVHLETGDRLVSVQAGVDTAYGYLFWNINRADGSNETWFNTGFIDAAAWSAPELLGVNMPNSETGVETGFNSGAVQVAKLGDLPLTWAMPASSSSDTLPVVVQAGDDLSLIYWRSGAIIGYQRVASAVGMIGAPALLTTPDQHLDLAWAVLAQDAPESRLLFTTTRPE